MDKCCDNCTFAHDIVGCDLAWCSKCCRSVDYNMFCSSYSNKEKDASDIVDWLQEIIDNPEEWKQFYSDSEAKLLAEKAKELISISWC